MPLEPDRRYDGVVIDAGLSQADTGTPQFWFKIKTEDGVGTHEEHVTSNTIVRVKKTMQECFGLTAAQLSNPDFCAGISEHVRGFEVSITTVEEKRQNGDLIVKIKWMNPRGFAKKPPTPATASRVAALFGGTSAPPAPRPPAGDGPPPFAPEPLDDDIPW